VTFEAMTMTIGRKVRRGWLPVFCVAACGCGGSQEPAKDPAAPITVNTAELPELADPIPLLDGGRIEAAPPKGWDVPARSSKFVVRFQQRTDLLYPTIIITAEDYAAIPDVTRENVNEFAARLAADESLGTVKPIEVGPFVGVTYRKRGIEKGSLNKILEQLFLETAVAGRKYSIELRTREGSLPETEPYLMAVAGGIKFLTAAPPEPAGANAEAKPEAAAEPKPAGGGEKEEATPAEKPKKDDLDLDNLNLDELLK
jgi:hypothetical protein